MMRKKNDNDDSDTSSKNTQLIMMKKNINKNSWNQLEDNQVLEEPDLHEDKENFWLRLLHMMATVYPSQLRGDKWKRRIGWFIFPLVIHLLCVDVIIICVVNIIKNIKLINDISHPEQGRHELHNETNFTNGTIKLKQTKAIVSYLIYLA